MRAVGLVAEPNSWRAEIALSGRLTGWRVWVLCLLREEGVTLAELKLMPGPYPSAGTIEPDHPLGTTPPEHLAMLPKGGLSRRLLKDVPVGAIVRYVKDELEAAVDDPLIISSDLWEEVAQKRLSQPVRRGDDRNHLMWAIRYEQATRKTDKPIALLAEQYRFKPSQVRDLVAATRRRGLLTNPGRGRAGGVLTDKARQLLREEKA